ncbi:MAG: aminomethyl-transferring glycine dehydrogenase subunit GcvPA, partial [Vagococcus salmoninarum]
MGLGKYVASTTTEQLAMLESLGMSSLDDLYVNVPGELKIKELAIPKSRSEFEVRQVMMELAQRNKVFGSIFRGAGAYNHYIPSLVKQIA